jgi:hypothetical protein
LNFWPFSKKTKVGKSQASDLPPGVVLALSESETLPSASPVAQSSDLAPEDPASGPVPDEQAFALPPLPMEAAFPQTEILFPQEETFLPSDNPSLNQSLAVALEEALAQSMRPLSLSDTGSILAQPIPFDLFQTSGTSEDDFPSDSQELHSWPVAEFIEESAEDFGLPLESISVWPSEIEPSEIEEAVPLPNAFPGDDGDDEPVFGTVSAPDSSSPGIDTFCEEVDEPVPETISAPDSLASVIDTFYTEVPSDWDWGNLSTADGIKAPSELEEAPGSPVFAEAPALPESEPEEWVEVEAEENDVCPASEPEASGSDPRPEPVAEARKDLHRPLSDSYADVPLPDTDGQSFLSAENESLIVHLENFERGVIQQEAKFLKRSIDNLVDAYFARQESEPS